MKERRHIYEIGDPENCSGCRQMEYFLKRLSKERDVPFSLIPFSFVRKNSAKNISRIKKLYGKLPGSIPVVIIQNSRGTHIFDADTGFEGIEGEC